MANPLRKAPPRGMLGLPPTPTAAPTPTKGPPQALIQAEANTAKTATAATPVPKKQPPPLPHHTKAPPPTLEDEIQKNVVALVPAIHPPPVSPPDWMQGHTPMATNDPTIQALHLQTLRTTLWGSAYPQTPSHIESLQWNDTPHTTQRATLTNGTSVLLLTAPTITDILHRLAEAD